VTTRIKAYECFYVEPITKKLQVRQQNFDETRAREANTMLWEDGIDIKAAQSLIHKWNLMTHNIYRLIHND
jgi:hypothetical protein